MSAFDVHESACADDLIVHMGEREGVEIATASGPVTYPAIVGRLRLEEHVSIVAHTEQFSQREVCRVSVKCPPGALGMNQRIVVEKFTAGDGSQRNQQAFHVRAVEAVSENWTTVEVARDYLAKWQSRGVERQ